MSDQQQIRDLTLPATAPSVAQYQDLPMSFVPTALYTLADISDSELRELQQICESGCIHIEPGTYVQLAPQARFVNQPLRAVFDYHLELGAEGKFDPIYFIVATDEAWRANGVLLVTLDDDDLKCKVDSFRIEAKKSGLSVATMQIGNSDWYEQKEGSEITPGMGGNRSEGDDSVEGKQIVKGEDSGPGAPNAPPPLDSLETSVTGCRI